MAYHVIKKVKGYCYHYIMRSERVGEKVRVRTLEYLGRDPDPKRLKRALGHWGVKAKHGKRRRGGAAR